MSASESQPKRIGVLSDTHGLLRPSVIDVFQGVEVILHAGDVGDPVVLDELGKVAPVQAVRGNMDQGELFEQLPATAMVECLGLSIYVLHDLLKLDLNPAASGVGMIVHGHTHTSKVEQRQGVWYVNPGCAGRSRGRPSVVLVEIRNGLIRPQIISV